ncbi:MAG: hypothetical protein Q8P83_02355 [bacterium]|nr:hypothetical protein [bacterium]
MSEEINALLSNRAEDERLIVAIGGYCTLGKSTLAKQLAELLVDAVVLQTDSFEPDRATKRKLGVTGDEPEAIDFGQMIEAIKSLVNGKPTLIRDYDHTNGVHCEWREVSSARVIILDGTSSLYEPMRGISDVAVFLTADENTLSELARTTYRTVRNFGDEEFENYWSGYTSNRRLYIDQSIDQAGIIVKVTQNRSFVSTAIRNCTNHSPKS